jgi:hypothetical protein
LLEDQPGVAEAAVAHAAAAGALDQRDLLRRHAVEAGAWPRMLRSCSHRPVYFIRDYPCKYKGRRKNDFNVHADGALLSRMSIDGSAFQRPSGKPVRLKDEPTIS